MAKDWLVIFDMDGTLFQAGLVTVPAVQQTFVARGLPAPSADIIQWYSGAHIEHWHGWLKDQCPPGTMHDIVAEADERELALIGEAGALYPGTMEILLHLKAEGCTIATSSNAPQDYFDEVMRTQGLKEVVDLPFCRGNGSQFPDKTAIAGHILSACAKRPAAVVGDRVGDVEAALAHGIFAVAATYGFGSEDEWVGAHARIDTIKDLPDALARLTA